MSNVYGESEAYDGKRSRGELSDNDSRQNDAKRRKEVPKPNGLGRSQEWTEPSTRLQHSEYTVGWICALPTELAASQAMLDCIHASLPTKQNDDNAYTLGNIGKHNVVMACLPLGQYGTNNAAIVASNMHRSFPLIRIRLMVGIGGGVPGDLDIRLGDIVVGKEVIQYDMGKILSGGRIQRTGISRIPPPILLKAISQLQARHERTASAVPYILRDMIERYPRLSKYTYSTSLEDRLFRSTYEHDQKPDCNQCEVSELLYRSVRSSQEPKVHYGIIASGNQVVKSGRERDALAKELNVICFEMEAAGLMDIFPCLVIRGICDYADSHKNKQWQPYAAATAAAFAKELLSVFTPNATMDAPVAVRDRQASSTPRQIPDDDEKITQNHREDLLELLRFDQLDVRHATIKVAHRQTCAWLLKHDDYKDWLDPTKAAQHHGFLWISGKPGAGKSTLMKFALSNVRKHPDANTAYISFFFNARGHELERSIVGLHRSLLLQLLERFPDLQSVLDDPVIPRNQPVCPTTEVLQQLLHNAVMGLGQRRLICFVDALDECDEEQVREMVEYFEDLGEETTAGGLHLQICFSSRHYPHIEIQNGIELTLEDQVGHAEDLEKYVRNSLRFRERSDLKEIQAGVLEKANGVFMWVVLVVDILKDAYRQGRISAAKEKLGEIPSGLSDLFKDILSRDNEKMEGLLLCIQWILYAKRPLTREEFFFGMLSGLPNEDLAMYSPKKITDKDFELFVAHSSKGLAEITKSKNGTIQFIHESVRDFLIKDNGLQELWPRLGKSFKGVSHDKLKKCCQAYISHGMSGGINATEPLPKANSEEAKELRHKTSGDFPFLRYATENILHHADVAALETSQDDFLGKFRLQDLIHLNNLFEKHQIRRYTTSADLTYILAEKNFVKLLELWTQNHSQVHIEGERYGFPILAALANGHLIAAKTLLGQAASLHPTENIFAGLTNKESLVFRKSQGPLHWAIENRQPALAAILITSEKVDLAMTDAKKRMAIHWAAIVGDEATMVLLVTKMVDPHQQDLSEMKLSSQAAQASDTTTVKFQAGSAKYINSTHVDLSPSLCLAAEQSLGPAIRITLESRDSIDIKGNTGKTALHYAARWGHEAIVRILFKNRASIDIKDNAGETALHNAAFCGHEAIVRILLENRASIDIRGNDGKTALHYAASYGHDAVVRILLKNGASIDIKNNAGETALHDAARWGCEAVVRILLENGASINVTSKTGNTALHNAVHDGNETVVKLLSHAHNESLL